MSKAAMGVNVQYCGHNGYFVADILEIDGVNVVRASGPVSPDNIMRHEEFGPATHHLSDFPRAGFWQPKLGVFVVPKNQVIKL
ncbi:MAG: hypothetical protein WA734_07440 [Candidatus Acidiferrales bacterium]